MDLATFHQNLPIKVKDIFIDIAKHGFKVGVIGGICRDYLLTNHVGIDFDCEVRPKDGHNISDWKKVKDYIIETYSAQIMSYDVLKVEFSDSTLEITLPRIEHFDGGIGHSNFSAEFIEDLDYTKGFIRRDFTINSIMFEFDGKKWQVHDPLNGISDLNEKILKECSSQFLLDPVRFLRAFRFKINLNFTFSESLAQMIETINLSSLTPHYLKQELSKCKKPLLMLKKMLEIRNELHSDIVIHATNKAFIDYDKFYSNDLENHIKQAVIMPIQLRQTLLKYLGFSDKHILFNIIYEESWKTIIQDDFNSEKLHNFHETISQLEKLDLKKDKLEYLLAYFAIDLSSDQFESFKNIKYELSSSDLEQPKEYYKYIIFKKRFKVLND